MAQSSSPACQQQPRHPPRATGAAAAREARRCKRGPRQPGQQGCGEPVLPPNQPVVTASRRQVLVMSPWGACAAQEGNKPASNRSAKTASALLQAGRQAGNQTHSTSSATAHTHARARAHTHTHTLTCCASRRSISTDPSSSSLLRAARARGRAGAVDGRLAVPSCDGGQAAQAPVPPDSPTAKQGSGTGARCAHARCPLAAAARNHASQQAGDPPTHHPAAQPTSWHHSPKP